MTASLGDFQYLLPRSRLIFFTAEELPGRETRANAEEEHAYLLLEDDDEGDGADGDDAVEEGTGQVELEHKRHEEPNNHEGQNTPEEVGCAGLAEQAVHLIHDTCDQQDIDHIFEAERKS